MRKTPPRGPTPRRCSGTQGLARGRAHASILWPKGQEGRALGRDLAWEVTGSTLACLCCHQCPRAQPEELQPPALTVADRASGLPWAPGCLSRRSLPDGWLPRRRPIASPAGCTEPALTGCPAPRLSSTGPGQEDGEASRGEKPERMLKKRSNL
ncbi:hypothetical protein J0S82_018346 [Galemys pyrenaicus]|uniref:Uncharacterized protein n=1 Tax=Galemys pyrenaicus TaxID=202257 RepID=A0A8J6DET2_GALPY|nr:hypothetical protein J0S82_018346 [Galemys pyrenaicus]